uniref:PH domain-containing protein n=1 Tax=Salarias fasciatus TaxID=181472 RepID=A0A672H152_SALFA
MWSRATCLLCVASVLKRWKLNWCDLWIDGSLCFYKTDSRREFEHRVSLKTTCIDVRSGLECGGVTPPESNPRENLIAVLLHDGSSLNLCANSEDDSIQKLRIESSFPLQVFTYDPYDDSYQAVPLSSYRTVYITPGAGPEVTVNLRCCNLFKKWRNGKEVTEIAGVRAGFL